MSKPPPWKPTETDEHGVFQYGDDDTFKVMIAPNRYRRLMKEGATTKEYWESRAESVRMQARELP